MRCPACDGENPESARYCASCGGRLATACPHCQAVVGLGVRFCTSCGGSITADTTDGVATENGPDAEPPAERRRISVLFVDLENFTALAESLDPEELRIVQSRYFEVARSVVARYGGTIEKFIGDAVMAVWGAPLAHEDDAERAVRAALEIVDAVGRLGGAASGSNLTARAAVATGQAAVTLGAIGQGMVAGDLVNVAARLQARAPVGSVLVDTETRQMAAEAASFERAGSLSLKGRTARLAAFHATKGANTRPGRRVGSHSGPFVGRDRELRELSELFDGVARERRCRLVSVTGIAGIGKSRLAWELHEHLDGLPQDVAWHAGRAPAYGEDITFAAVAEMVRRRIRVSDNVPPELARRQLAAALGEFVRDDVERSWMEPRLAVLLGGDENETFERYELFAAWRRFFERVSDLSPAVLVFEDLQWAEPSLLEFIEHLASWTRDHPILILGLARPELMERRPAWGAGLGSFTALHLERLPDAAMRGLLTGHAPDVPDPLVRQVLERAGGVPLYAVEVVRILADRRTPGAGRGSSHVPSDAEREMIEIPHSLHGLIAARIDALPAHERRLLLAAAILGRRFRPDAVVAIAGTEPALTRERLDGLLRRELLAINEDGGSPGRGELGFVQDLVREVAYGTLSRSERRALHLGAARYLESHSDDELAASLAHHLVQVHQLAPGHPDAPRIARRAVAALRRAARDAIRLHVPERALGQLEHAMRLNQVPEQRIALLGETAAAARAAGRLDVAERHLREQVAALAEAGMPREEASARAHLASVLLTAQRNEPALAELESALETIEDIGADAASVELAAQLARARMLMGNNQAGFEWAERALDAARRLGIEPVAADILVTRGTARFRLGQEAVGLEDLRAAIVAAEESGAIAVELRARNNLAWLSVADDPRSTLETARQGYELATAMGVGDMAVQLADVACAAAIETGDWAWALETATTLGAGSLPDEFRMDLGASVAIIRSLQGHPQPMAAVDAMPMPSSTDPQVLAGLLHARAWASFVAGAFDEARRFAMQAAESSLGAERANQWTLATRSSLWLRDPEAAAAGLHELRGLGLSGRAVHAASMTMEAGVVALSGREEARRRYRRAAEAWRELDLPFHLALTLLDAQRLLGDAGDGGEALAILAALGADGLAAVAISAVSPAAGPPRPARSRPPSARTAHRTGGGRRRPRATDRRVPPG
ncbi:MAG: AAA family ATPase [Chloroflexi bacterium]|nr:AAA family ATPase [Chloroflexota bacterium]